MVLCVQKLLISMFEFLVVKWPTFDLLIISGIKNNLSSLIIDVFYISKKHLYLHLTSIRYMPIVLTSIE